MTDDPRKRIVTPPPSPAIRAGTILGDRNDSRRTPLRGSPISLAVPHEIPDEITGQYEGEALAELRRRRPDSVRIGRLEDKHDALHEVVTQTRVEVGEMRGEIRGEFQALRDAREREQLAYRQTTEIGTAEQLAKIDTRAHGVKTRREWVTQGLKIAAVIGGAIATFAAGRC